LIDCQQVLLFFHFVFSMANAQLSRPNVETEAEVEAQIAADLHIQWETPSTPPNPDDYVIVNGILTLNAC
jgi:hypothetical protein